MCGIAGIVSRKGISEVDLRSVQAMNAAMVHRGPDGKGEYHDRDVSLAMRRLSIIDLQGGWQPLYNEDRTLVLVVNGEVYNFVELREALKAKGHHFSTESDGEVILHLYEDHGDECIAHLRGMFAFALWDIRKRRLLLARDRMGEKPLYLYQDNQRIVMASELRAILASGFPATELDSDAVNHYFHYHYVPEPMTPVKDVRKLSAGCLLSVDLHKWTINERRYWDILESQPLDGTPEQILREQLEETCRLTVRSDVPVGIALSGGLDSTAIAALASRAYPGVMHAFCAGYPGQLASDERSVAKLTADRLNMPFTEIELETSAFVSSFQQLVGLADDPIADIAAFGYYSVAKAASDQDVPVLLQGQGGDELFWGYGWTRRALRESRLRRLRSQIGWLALPLYIRLTAPQGLRPWQIKQWVASAFGAKACWRQFRRDCSASLNSVVFYDLVPDFIMAMRDADSIYASSFKDELSSSSGPTALFSAGWLEHTKLDLAITRLVCETYLLENGITQGDRLAMASSVELRLPLLDYRLVETVIGLRKAHSDAKLPPKKYLKDAIWDILPDHVKQLPKKGFTPPVREWHNAVFREYGELLIDGYLVQAGVLSEEAGRKLSRGAFPAFALAPLSFKALVLEIWCRQIFRFRC